MNPHEVFCPGIADTLIVEAGDGNDMIDVSGAPSALALGDAGDDLIVAALGAGGPGDDELRGIASAGRLRGGPGDDTISAGPAGGAIFGSDGDDTLVGGAGRDVIWGGEGPCGNCAPVADDDDVIRGGAGDDVLHVEEGRDRLDGERGNDSYVVGASARRVATTIADSGGDTGDRIVVACAGARLTASGGSGRYTLPGGTIAFSGLDGALPCAAKVVPRVVGLSLARARRALAAAGFRVGRVTYRRSASVRRGLVLAQRPVAGPPGTAVSLVVSSGRR